jgi:apolipoprotein N-acyltransferase
MGSIFGFIASVASGLLAAAAFPPVEIPWLIWVSLVPLLFVLTRCRVLPALVYTFVFCLVFHSGIFYWMFQLAHYRLLHHLMLGLLLSIWLGFACLAVNRVAWRYGALPALISAPLAWVCYEWLRSNVGFLSLPWGLLAHSQYGQVTLIQSAELAGTWALSALIVGVNSALTALVYPVLLGWFDPASLPGLSFRCRHALWFAFTAATILLANTGYGYWSRQRPLESAGIQVAAVQGNIAQHQKWDEAHRADIMATYTSLSLSAGRQHPALIIWPETATPRSISFDRDTYREVKSIADRTQTRILLGSARVQKFKPNAPQDVHMKNSAYLITPGKMLIEQRYDKIRLLPFGEYLPLDAVVPWQRLGIRNYGNFKPGTRPYVFFTKGFRFAAPICWENIFPQLTRAFVRNGAQFIVNITNEAWFGQSSAPYHFLAMNVFRAVENRRSVVRSANTGITCIIDPRGQVVDRLRDSQGNDIFIRGILSGRVPLNDAITLYTRWGDWFVGFCLVVWIILLMVFERRHNRSHA